MSSLWSSTATSAGASAFGKQSAAPTPGGSKTQRFQSILQAAGKQGRGAVQPGLSPASAKASAANPAATTGTSSSASDASDATISANDFLTLLVTEMQNQDPTADVDPNAYIDQLVQINSLEQLISINQNLASVLGAASTTSHTANASSAASKSNLDAASTGSTHVSPASAISGVRAANQPATVRGNLAAPGSAPSARTVGRALDGRSRGNGAGHAIRDIPTRALP